MLGIRGLRKLGFAAVWTPGEFTRARILRSLVAGIGMLALIWLLTISILAATSDSLIWLGLELAMIVIVVAILHNWRSGFYMFLVWLLFEDLARKYMGNNMAIYLGKDLLVGVVYISFI